MNWLGLLKGLLKGWLVFYLVTHAVSRPADGELELGELAASLYYGGLGLQRLTSPPIGSWAMARNDFHGNAGVRPAVSEESKSRASNSRTVIIGGRLAPTAWPRQGTA